MVNDFRIAITNIDSAGDDAFFTFSGYHQNFREEFIISVTRETVIFHATNQLIIGLI